MRIDDVTAASQSAINVNEHDCQSRWTLHKDEIRPLFEEQAQSPEGLSRIFKGRDPRSTAGSYIEKMQLVDSQLTGKDLASRTMAGRSPD